jgi:hypothetical protein
MGLFCILGMHDTIEREEDDPGSPGDMRYIVKCRDCGTIWELQVSPAVPTFGPTWHKLTSTERRERRRHLRRLREQANTRTAAVCAQAANGSDATGTVSD